jgi:putative salt-induced outer membrane protein YdiY
MNPLTRICVRVIHVITIATMWGGMVFGQEPVGLPSPSATIGKPGEFILGDAKVFQTPKNDAGPGTAIPMMDDGSLGSDTIAPGSFSWILPTQWFPSSVWDRSIELGINGSEGNAQAFSILSAGHLKRDTDRSTLILDVLYGKSESNSILTQHYAFMNSRLDLKLGDSRWSIFNVARIEFDEFKAFDWRLSLSSGLGYALIQTDTIDLAGRFGAGGSREFGGDTDGWVAEAVFGADYEHKISDKQKLTLTSDYYPAWEEFTDYRLITTGSWELLLDEATNLSLKIGFLDRYDSTPSGRLANDIDYFATLLWKL